MTSPAPDPSPLIQRAMALKAQSDDVNAMATSAMTLIRSEPLRAEQMLSQTIESAEALRKVELEFLTSTGAPREQVAMTQINAKELRIQLLMGQGMVASILSKLPEARAFYETALAELGDGPHFAKPSILMALGQIALQGG